MKATSSNTRATYSHCCVARHHLAFDGCPTDGLWPCPCCGFRVFAEGPGSYDICPVCGWEDDHVQLANPALTGGANRRSLWEEQQDVLRRLPPEVTETAGYQRDPHWRPLGRPR